MKFPNLLKSSIIVLDTETTGLSSQKDRMFGLCVANEKGSWYYDIREHPDAIEWIRNQLVSTSCPIVFHNASFDVRFLHREFDFLPFIHRVEDTVIRMRCLREDLLSYSLDSLAERYLGERKHNELYVQMAAMFGGKPTRSVQMARVKDAPSSMVAPYGRMDAELTRKLYLFQEKALRETNPELQDICCFEQEKIPVFVGIEMHGIRVDVAQARRAREEVNAQLLMKELELRDMLGFEINVNSPPQVKKLFTPEPTLPGDPTPWRVGDVFIPATGSGAPSIDADALHDIAEGGDPRAQLVLEIRSLIKTGDTFLGTHILEHEHEGRVYPTVRQFGTKTGRLSVSEPAMQQIPSRNKKVAQVVKSCFLPDKGQVWLDCDMASFEVRVFAHLVGEESILQQYRDDPMSDFHQMVADMTGLVRNAEYAGQPNAKQLNLSMIFNSGNGAIADKMGMPWTWEEFEKDGKLIRYKKAGPAAMRVIDKYHRKLPGVKRLAERCKNEALMNRHVKTHYGRKIRFSSPEFAYKASGLLIQATAADINKVVVCIMDDSARKRNGRLLLNTHDSYSLSLPLRLIDNFWYDVHKQIEQALHWFTVPLPLELSGVGNTWWGALSNELSIRL